MDIYIRIKELRQDKKLTQKVISGLINIDSSQYSKIELGKLQPTLTQIMAISSFFKVSMDWLCFGKGSMLNNEIAVPGNSHDGINYKDIDARFIAIESKFKKIYVLEEKIVSLNNTIEELKGPSVPRGSVGLVNEPSLKPLSGK